MVQFRSDWGVGRKRLMDSEPWGAQNISKKNRGSFSVVLTRMKNYWENSKLQSFIPRLPEGDFHPNFYLYLKKPDIQGQKVKRLHTNVRDFAWHAEGPEFDVTSWRRRHRTRTTPTLSFQDLLASLSQWNYKFTHLNIPFGHPCFHSLLQYQYAKYCWNLVCYWGCPLLSLVSVASSFMINYS